MIPLIPMKISKSKCMILLFLLLIFIYILLSVTTNNTIAIVHYNLKSPLLNEQSNIKIVLVSDLHSGVYGKDQSILIDKIKNSSPDLIVLAGDIFDDLVPMTGAKLFLSGIADIAPVYFVTGNHEHWSSDLMTIHEVLLSYGVTILSDEYTNIIINNNEIVLAGIEDPAGLGVSGRKLYEISEYDQNYIMEKMFRELDEISLYKILVAHRPEKIDLYTKYSFNLVLSGHTHGGQVRIPYMLNGLYAPNQGLFPKYGGGVYTHGNLIHIISRGLSKKYKLPRVWNPPELVIITIEAGI